MKIWVSSDLHLGQTNILKFVDDNNGNLLRGSIFNDIKDHDETILRNHTNVFSIEDKWYCLGDVFFRCSEEYLDNWFNRIIIPKKRRILLIGNHDTYDKHKLLSKYFSKIELWRKLTTPKNRIKGVMCHIPIYLGDSNHDHKFCIHGHIHHNKIKDSRYYNASLENTSYSPVQLETILRTFEDK